MDKRTSDFHGIQKITMTNLYQETNPVKGKITMKQFLDPRSTRGEEFQTDDHTYIHKQFY